MDMNVRCVCLWEKQVYQGESGGFHPAPLQHRRFTYLKPGQEISTAEDIKGYVPQGKSEQRGWSTVYESMLMLSALGLLARKWLLSWGLDFQSFLAKAEEWKWFMLLLTLGLKKLQHTFSSLSFCIKYNWQPQAQDSGPWQTPEKEAFDFKPLGCGCNST